MKILLLVFFMLRISHSDSLLSNCFPKRIIYCSHNKPNPADKRTYPLSLPYYLKNITEPVNRYNSGYNNIYDYDYYISKRYNDLNRKYPFSKQYYEAQLRRLNMKYKPYNNFENKKDENNYKENINENIKNELHDEDDDDGEGYDIFQKLINDINGNPENKTKPSKNNTISGFRIVIKPNLFTRGNHYNNEDGDTNSDSFPNPFTSYNDPRLSRQGYTGDSNEKDKKDKKSENFEVITDCSMTFKDIGGFDKIKDELRQCVEFLVNYKKYAGYNVRVPKGLIMEGPPGNGKTLLAKGLAGEANVSFIPVSGSEFQEKYVGVGSAKVRELFKLAKKNIPCIVFIDEIDAIGRTRSGDGESASSERDNTLNELLVALDGFKNNTGIFLVGATNRIDLLDPALIRPGRIDKKIYIGVPDADTRKAIIDIHKNGKPMDTSVDVQDLVDITMGLSGAQIENLLNEAMLNALRNNKTSMSNEDIDIIMNKMMAGWQPTDHTFSSSLIDQIAIHEMGHAIVGLLAKHHTRMTKVIINLSSPQSPAYTVFEGSTTSIYTREALFEHLIILLAGRTAEEMFYTTSVTTGAINDFEEAFKLAEKMVVYYGMGENIIYPKMSEKYKEKIDNEVSKLISDAYTTSFAILKDCKPLMLECAEVLKKSKLLKRDEIIDIIREKYQDIFHLIDDVNK